VFNIPPEAPNLKFKGSVPERACKGVEPLVQIPLPASNLRFRSLTSSKSPQRRPERRDSLNKTFEVHDYARRCTQGAQENPFLPSSIKQPTSGTECAFDSLEVYASSYGVLTRPFSSAVSSILSTQFGGAVPRVNTSSAILSSSGKRFMRALVAFSLNSLKSKPGPVSIGTRPQRCSERF